MLIGSTSQRPARFSSSHARWPAVESLISPTISSGLNLDVTSISIQTFKPLGGSNYISAACDDIEIGVSVLQQITYCHIPLIVHTEAITLQK